MPSRRFYLILWTGPVPVEGVSGDCSLLPYSIEFQCFKAINVDPDQTPRSVASDQGLYCLPMSFYKTPDINGLMVKHCMLFCSYLYSFIII